MRVGVLFSGGKDSTLALHYAKQYCEVSCLITVVSKNPHSYMFHTPNIDWVDYQAKAIGLEIVKVTTEGVKEKELKDLERAILLAKKRFNINGIVSGAVASVYQATRIQKICNKLKLECFNPLWLKDQFELLNELVKLKFEVIITGVFGEGLEGLIGRKVDESFINEIRRVYDKLRINPAGEGGEFESFVLDAPFFKQKLEITSHHIKGDALAKVMYIDGVRLVEK